MAFKKNQALKVNTVHARILKNGLEKILSQAYSSSDHACIPVKCARKMGMSSDSIIALSGMELTNTTVSTEL